VPEQWLPDQTLRAQTGEAQAYKRSSTEAQASKPSAKGSSFKPESTSSKILEPGYKRQVPSLGEQATSTKVQAGCFMWNETWCGDRDTEYPFVTLSSKVKNVPLEF